MTRRMKTLVAYASSMIALMIFDILVSMVPPFTKMSEFLITIHYSFLSQVFCMGILPFVIFMALNKWKVGDEFVRMRYKKPRDVKTLLIVCVCICVFAPGINHLVSICWNGLLILFGYFPTGGYLPYETTREFVLFICLSSVLPAVFEEFTHRGLLLSGLERGGSEISAVMLSALLFGLMHGNISQLGGAFLVGIPMAILVIKTDCIIPSMLWHFVNNFEVELEDYSRKVGNKFSEFLDFLYHQGFVPFLCRIAIYIVAIALLCFVLKYVSKKAPKPQSSRKYFGVVELSSQPGEEKASLKENWIMIAVILAEGLFVLAKFFWGVAD